MRFSVLTNSLSFFRPAKSRHKNAYAKSLILTQLDNASKKRIAFLDIDSTMTGNPDMTNKTRHLLEEQGYAIVYATTRTEEMLMSKPVYDQSIKNGSFSRPMPNLAKKGDVHRYIAPEKHMPEGLLNPDIIVGSTGTQILVRQKDGHYKVDSAYDENFSQKAIDWKKMTLNLIHQADPQHIFGTLSNVDQPDNYLSYLTNVAAPKYRIGISFTSLKKKMDFINRLSEIEKDRSVYTPIRKHFAHVRIIDDSNPQANQYRIYLTPKKASKAVAVEHIVNTVCKQLQLDRSELEILLAGDSFPDLEMGLKSGVGTKATFLLVGGSRLTEVLLSETVHEFAGETLVKMKQTLVKTNLGRYRFTTEIIDREVIIADEMYEGEIAVETIYSYLRQGSLN